MNRKQKIILYSVLIFLVILLLLGFTYGYFMTKIIGNDNEKSISVTSGTLELTYGENTSEILGDTKVEPGYSVTKTFSATNTGDRDVIYGAVLENIENSFTRQEDIVYTLICKSYKKGTTTISGTCDGKDETQFPATGDVSLMITNTIPVGITHSYELTITYKNLKIDQSIDMGNKFSARVNIRDLDTLNPYTSNTNTLKYNIINNAIKASTASEESDTTRTTLGSEVTEFTSISGSNEHVLNTAPDDYGTSYYFRGNVIDNYVSFADKTWRIVRINGDGTVRLILDDVAKDSSGTEITSAFNSSYNDNAYVGYMYGTAGSTTYDATHKNINDSTIKKAVDKWYEDNLKTNYVNYLSDTLFCGDKTLAESGIGSNNTAKGYGTNITYYSATERLMYSSGTTAITTSTPTFKCAEKANDNYSRYTTTKSTLPNGKETNGNLKYPIGLLTADEVAYAGAYKSGRTNKSYYLYNSSITSYWWLSSPLSCDGSNVSSAYVWYVLGYNGVISDLIANVASALRPSINLKAELLINGGDGTSSNPYTVN